MGTETQCPFSLRARKIRPYQEFVGKRVIAQIEKIARRLRGKSWTHVNTTYCGGGVAEILRNQIPLLKGLGIDARWRVIEGNRKFFEVTKRFHNALQGIKEEFSLKDFFDTYLGTIAENFRSVKINSDIVTVHDPQPAAIIAYASIKCPSLWRCHIDTSEAEIPIWRFLQPYMNLYSGTIFTIPEFVREGLPGPVYQIEPAIDPLHPKNALRDKKKALKDLGALFQKHNIDPQRPLIVGVSRYDVHKNQKATIQAFKLLKKKLSSKVAPLLILLGNSVSDDPEGDTMYKKMKDLAGKDKDIHLLLNVNDNDKVVGSLMHLADCFVHVSTKEGFGLVVTEALWQGTPVIGSRVGGIPRQIIHGENGYLVDPRDCRAIAKYMKKVVSDKGSAKAMGQKGHEHVRRRFLMPYKILKELKLMEYCLGQSSRSPDFVIKR